MGENFPKSRQTLFIILLYPRLFLAYPIHWWLDSSMSLSRRPSTLFQKVYAPQKLASPSARLDQNKGSLSHTSEFDWIKGLFPPEPRRVIASSPVGRNIFWICLIYLWIRDSSLPKGFSTPPYWFASHHSLFHRPATVQQHFSQTFYLPIHSNSASRLFTD